MKVHELIARLRKLDGNLEVAILDGFNGGGQPRSLNLGPVMFDPAEYSLSESANYEDLDSRKGATIVIMGYGCY